MKNKENRVVLVDTSSWIEALRTSGRKDVRERVRRLVVQGHAAWCDMVLLELWAGARGEYEQQKLREMESVLDCLPVNKDVWRYSNRLALQCRKAGYTVPCADLIIASCALFHSVELEHCDSHLDIISEAVKNMSNNK